MAKHEHTCFVDHTLLEEKQIDTYSLIDGPPGAAALSRYDALLVGGSGDYYVSKADLPHFDAVVEFFAGIISGNRPMFASCFGFHCIVRALGGAIIHDPENTEVGSYQLELTDEGRADPLFGILPATFWAQEGHKDRAASNPEGVPNLASSVLSPMQALRIPGKPIWATQFHPELDRESNLHRFEHYQSGYAKIMSLSERQEALSRFQESPETSKLLPEFLRLAFG